MNRRHFLAANVGALGALGYSPSHANNAWSQGRIRHLIPTCDDQQIQLKVVFAEPQTNPQLRLGHRRFAGQQVDRGASAYTFHATGLAPNTEHELSLWQGDQRLSDTWPVKTHPHPEAHENHLRLLVYTCAGGHPLMSEGAQSGFLPMATRRALLARGLSFKPDALIAIGDQVYWDQRTTLEAQSPRRQRAVDLYAKAGFLDWSLAATSQHNDAVLKLVAGEQITPLYDTQLRSTPSYFINDDHDYFENDEATDRFVTLPPYAYQQRFADHVRNLYLPDFLSDPRRTQPLVGDRKVPSGQHVNASFGALRWGKLAEILMYDCAGHLSLKGASAGLVPQSVEAWLVDRTLTEDVAQLIHMPSHPFGWSAGKWREWYPDVADTGQAGAQVAQMGVEGQQFRLTTDKPKFMWQQGWWTQHQRLLGSLTAQKRRAAIVMSGDLHASGHAQITASDGLDLASNPINTMITGPLGTGLYWPSQARGTAPTAASALTLESPATIREKNGFSIVDITPDHVRVRLFAWRRELDSVTDIDHLTPYHDVRIQRDGLS